MTRSILLCLAVMLTGCASKDWSLNRQTPPPIQIVVHVHLDKCTADTVLPPKCPVTYTCQVK